MFLRICSKASILSFSHHIYFFNNLQIAPLTKAKTKKYVLSIYISLFKRIYYPNCSSLRSYLVFIVKVDKIDNRTKETEKYISDFIPYLYLSVRMYALLYVNVR